MKDKGLKVLAHIASNPIKWTIGLGAAGIAQSLYSKRKKKKRTKTVLQKIQRTGQMISKFLECLNQKGLNRNYLQGDVIKALSGPQLQRGFKKRDMFIKNLKNPKFRAKAKLKDYKSVL